MKLKVKGTEYGTVAQYIYGLQADLFMAVAAGVVIQQHTRVLMVDLHMRADGMSVAEVHAGLQQLAAEIDAAYRAARVGPTKIKKVVDEYSSGAHGKAAVDRRVAEANARIAVTLCECAVCVRAAEDIRGRSRLAQEECSSSAAVDVVERQAAEMGCSGEEATHGLQQSATEAQLLTRRQKESKRKKANKRKKKAALGARLASGVGTEDQHHHEAALEASGTSTQAGHTANWPLDLLTKKRLFCLLDNRGEPVASSPDPFSLVCWCEWTW